MRKVKGRSVSRMHPMLIWSLLLHWFKMNVTGPFPGNFLILISLRGLLWNANGQNKQHYYQAFQRVGCGSRSLLNAASSSKWTTDVTPIEGREM